MSSSLWTRRTTSGKLSLSMSNAESNNNGNGNGNGNNTTDPPPSGNTRSFASAGSLKPRNERGGSVAEGASLGSSHGGRFNPFNAVSPLATSNSMTSLSSPTSAFGLGSGAFAAFGAAIKTPTKPSTDPMTANTSTNASSSSTPAPSTAPASNAPTFASAAANLAVAKKPVVGELQSHPLRYTWVVWYRSPGTKFQDYEKSTQKIASFSTVEEFWTVHSHLKRPNQLPHVSDYHLFKKGIRPVWEDDENRKGGKWIIRLKKGVSTRYWEDLVLAIIGDQFGDSGEDLCGAVLSIRSAEDVLSVWTRVGTGANLKIRETIKRVLAFPPDTVMVFKSHDESIAHERNVHQSQQQKHSNQGNKSNN